MPINEHELVDIRLRLYAMFMDTIATFEAIDKNAEKMYGDRANDMGFYGAQLAVKEKHVARANRRSITATSSPAMAAR